MGADDEQPSIDPYNFPELCAGVLRWLEAEEAAQRVPRWSRWQRLTGRITGAVDFHSEFAAEAASRAAVLPEGALEQLARHLVLIYWRQSASVVTPHGNPWHPRLDERRAELTEEAVRGARSHTLRALARAADGPVGARRVVDVEGISSHLTPAFAAAVIEDHVQSVRAKASDPVFLHAYGSNARTGPAVVIQHKATGLRGIFGLTVLGDRQGAEVFSKPYSIGSIDPDSSGKCWWWEEYAGLGVGTRMYARAAELHPDVRWGGNGSNYANAVRRKLHADNPFQWQYHGCSWCSDHGVQWEDADRESYRGHIADPPEFQPS